MLEDIIVATANNIPGRNKCCTALGFKNDIVMRTKNIAKFEPRNILRSSFRLLTISRYFPFTTSLNVLSAT